MWRNTAGLGGEEMTLWGKKGFKTKRLRELFSIQLYLISWWRGGRREGEEERGESVSCLAAFQPADGLMAELRVEREAGVGLQLRLDPLHSTPTQHGASQTKGLKPKSHSGF